MKFKLGVIGAGNMANAIINGILSSKFISAENIAVTDIDENKLITFKEKGLFVKCNSNSEIANSSEYLLFAIKPQIFNSIINEFNNCQAKNLISIMAGITIEKLRTGTGIKSVCRIMPNTPCMKNEGMSALCFENYSKESENFVKNIFEKLGKTLITNENKLDAVTSVSGSGPAYVFEFAKAMIEGGTDGNLSEEESKLLTLQTIKGAVKMLESFQGNIDNLTEAVCSKGGTTIQAINYFREKNLNKIIREGMKLCKKRSEQLSKI